ncbi:ATP-binding cassette domain-containing protein, partial [Pediococcus acidilactici]|nr:ATP-binding cassette domain-containing protein [Pediococcus acidilactici]
MENLLNIKNLSYQRNLHSILKDLNLELPQGEIVGLLGANGAGKTTLMRLIAGSYIPRQGSIMINGDAQLVIRKISVCFTEQVSSLSYNQRVK